MISFQMFRKKSDLKCPTEIQPTEQKSKAEVLINFSNQFSHDDIYSNVKEAISKKPSLLEIDLVGLGSLPQDLCLSLWYLLTEDKDPKTHLVVSCSANLIDGQILLLIAADVKKIRPKTWMEISSLKKYEAMDFSRRNWSSKQFGSQHDEPFFITDYRNVFEVMNRYLPCELLSKGRVDIESTFREYGLLTSEQEEESFRNLFKAEPEEV